MILRCRTCKEVWTNKCPLRVYGRNEGNNEDVDIDKDFCSRFVLNFDCVIKAK